MKFKAERIEDGRVVIITHEDGGIDKRGNYVSNFIADDNPIHTIVSLFNGDFGITNIRWLKAKQHLYAHGYAPIEPIQEVKA